MVGIRYLIVIFTILLILIGILINIYNERVVIEVGILFTRSEGAMAENEMRLYNIIVEYIELYNQIQNKYHIRYYTYDPKSSTDEYIKGARIICLKNPSLIFGCWRSVDRKAILPIITKYNNLLCYPLQYEGAECSNNILYFGATPNQQINIGIEYAIKNISSKVLLIGSDYVFPRTANKIMKNYILNLNGTLVDEIYVDMDEKNFDTIAKNIIKKYSDDPIVIMNTINGESNKYFFMALYKYFKLNRMNDDKLFYKIFPIFSFSLTENDIHNYDLAYTYNQYFIWNYVHHDISYDTFVESQYPNNPEILNQILKKFKSTYINIDDPMYHVFISWLFFVEFLEKYTGPYDSDSVRKNYKLNKNIKILTPTGFLRQIENNHLVQPVYILKVNSDKKFIPIYRTPIDIKPNPWFDKFADVKYECNQMYKFMGSKYKI